jgi:hypothetical protein
MVEFNLLLLKAGYEDEATEDAQLAYDQIKENQQAIAKAEGGE